MSQVLDRPIAAPDTASTAVGGADRYPIRPLQTDDVERIWRFYDRLSARTVYRRFFTGGRPSVAELRRLFDAAPGAREVLVALSGDEVVGLAEYAGARARPDLVEIGVVVADAWQRRGIGLRLVRALLQRAAARGAVAVQADTLPENYPVACLLRRLWPDARPQLDDQVHTWCMPVGPALHAPTDAA